MKTSRWHFWSTIGLTAALALTTAASISGQSIDRTADAATRVLTPQEWERVDAAATRALVWLAAQQQPNGSFPTLDSGQPGVTCLCMLALMAHGHIPGDGPYGEHLKRASGYALSCQKQNGLITLNGPEGPTISREIAHEVGVTTAYNHGISALTLSELYGMRPADVDRLKDTITLALGATLEMQRWPKDREIDRGGWRYIDHWDDSDSDLSITGWQLMFLRSARNAGFDVPEKSIDDAVAYVRRTFTPRYGAFCYLADESVDHRSRGMAGAGILALAHAGYHNAPEATRSGDWILQYDFNDYNQIEPFMQGWKNDRYHYGLFNCCQAMYQLGGRYWQQFFPGAIKTLLANQQPDGSWPAENHHHDAQFGNAYTTALALLTLGAPNQLLPIYQR
jgi:hypothetical protein